MPRFYFHLRNDVIVDDEEGKDLADLPAAREVAIHTARHLAAESVLEGRLHLGHYIEIGNEYGHIVATIAFREAVTVEGC